MTRKSLQTTAVWLAGAAAIMPLAATIASAEPPASAPANPHFEPPAEPLLLTRTLRHPLPGGAEIRTQRSYEIQIVPEAGGYRVDGVLADVSVEAPAALQTLAALEKARPDDGLFPMRLDANGRFLSGQAPAVTPQMRQAAAVTGDKIRKLSLPRGESAQAQQFAGQLEKQPGQTPWPIDLFSPAAGPRDESRTFPLPNGTRGHVSVSIEASRMESLGLLSSFRRKITTEIGESTRVSEEIWTLSAKG